MDDLYDKVKDDKVPRKMWAEQCGFGFEPKTAEETDAAKAA